MYIFWSDFIQPILEELTKQERQIIVEIGSSTGENTKNILKFCNHTKSFCHIIDPLDIGNYEEIKSLLEANGKHHKTTSLEAIPSLIDGNVYLIDGDHNWYTVFHELDEIFRLHVQDKNPSSYPVLFFHDVEWPYARRDLYYQIDRIPPEFRQPSFLGGLIPGKSELSETEGINFGMNQAALSGGAKNGVLTGIEDALIKYNGLNFYDFYIVPGNSGLGCLFPKLRYGQSTAEFVKNRLTPLTHWKGYIHKFSDAYWNTEQARSLSDQKYDQLMEKYNELVAEYGVRMEKYNQLHGEARHALATLEKFNKSGIFKGIMNLRRIFKRIGLMS